MPEYWGIFPWIALFLGGCLEPLYPILMIFDILIEDLNILRRLSDLTVALRQAELHSIGPEFQEAIQE